jgi:hypothetical protein
VTPVTDGGTPELLSEMRGTLADYQSPYSQQESAVEDDPGAVHQMDILRGRSESDGAVSKAISGVIRKDYEIHVALSLEEWDALGEDPHGIQFREYTNYFPPITCPADLYNWSMEMLTHRGCIPTDAPPFQETEIKVERKRNGAYIPFVSRNQIGKAMGVEPNESSRWRRRLLDVLDAPRLHDEDDRQRIQHADPDLALTRFH